MVLCFRSSRVGFRAEVAHLFAMKLLQASAIQTHDRDGEMQFLIMEIIT